MKKILTIFISAIIIAFSIKIVRAIEINREYIPTKGTNKNFGALNLYIKKNLRNDRLTHNKVNTIAIGKNNVYIGTAGGLSVYNIKNGRFKHFNIHNGLTSNYISSILLDTKDSEPYVFLGTYNSLNILKKEKTYLPYLQSGNYKEMVIYDIFKDTGESKWLATNKGLIRLDKEGNIRYFNTENGALPSNIIYSVSIDNDNTVWIGANGIYSFIPKNPIQPYKYDLIEGRWSYYTPIDNAKISVTGVLDDGDGNIWFSTNIGVFKFNKKTRRWKHYALPELPSLKVNHISKYRDIIFASTDRGLVKIYKNGEIDTFTQKNGLLSDYVTYASADREGNIWIGTDEGASRLSSDGKMFTYFSVKGISSAKFMLTQEQLNILDERGRKRKEEEKIEKTKREEEKKKVLEKKRAERKGIFIDLEKKAPWAWDQIFFLLEKGVVKKAKLFHPNKIVTKEELLKMALLTAEIDIKDADTKYVPALDVPNNHWAAPYINKALELFIIKKAKNFGLGKKMTRLEALDIMLKSFEIELIDRDETKFSDVKKKDIPIVETASSIGIIKGYTEQSYIKELMGKHFNLNYGTVNKLSSQERIRNFQKAMKYLGFFKETPDGKFDSRLIDAIADYQVDRNVVAPRSYGWGAFGAKTQKRFFSEYYITGKIGEVKHYFKPYNTITRAETAVILYRLFEYRFGG